MSAIPASSVSMKTMVDGTLRISFDVEPGQAQDAFKLFAAPGTQVAIAALKDGSFLAQPALVKQNMLVVPEPRAQLGDACYRTVLWCNEPNFWDFLAYANILDQRPKDGMAAADIVRAMCNVESRKELDTNNEANKTWHRLIRQPYADYLKRLEAA